VGFSEQKMIFVVSELMMRLTSPSAVSMLTRPELVEGRTRLPRRRQR
jgi:hypothetical protein